MQVRQKWYQPLASAAFKSHPLSVEKKEHSLQPSIKYVCECRNRPQQHLSLRLCERMFANISAESPASYGARQAQQHRLLALTPSPQPAWHQRHPLTAASNPCLPPQAATPHQQNIPQVWDDSLRFPTLRHRQNEIFAHTKPQHPSNKLEHWFQPSASSTGYRQCSKPPLWLSKPPTKFIAVMITMLTAVIVRTMVIN